MLIFLLGENSSRVKIIKILYAFFFHLSLVVSKNLLMNLLLFLLIVNSKQICLARNFSYTCIRFNPDYISN